VPEDILEQFKLAMADEDFEEFGASLRRLQEACDRGDISAREPFLALLAQMETMMERHGGLMQRAAEEDPEIAEMLGRMGEWLEKLADS
jgi:hypothetical protein